MLRGKTIAKGSCGAYTDDALGLLMMDGSDELRSSMIGWMVKNIFLSRDRIDGSQGARIPGASHSDSYIVYTERREREM